MPNSLHETVSLAAFATWSKDLWDRWNRGSSGLKGTAYRKAQVKLCAQRALRTCGIPMCAVTTTNSTSYGGATDPLNWTIDIEGEYKKSSITLDHFAEIMKTSYHESRHVEQLYRMVQAVELGLIEWRVRDSSYKVVAKPTTPQAYQNAMGIKASAASHAMGNLQTYDRFANTARMNHCVRSAIVGRRNDKWTNTVSNWFDQMMSPTRMGLYTQIGNAAQYLANYANSEVDKDTFAVENLLYTHIKSKWANYGQKKDRTRISTVFPQP